MDEPISNENNSVLRELVNRIIDNAISYNMKIDHQTTDRNDEGWGIRRKEYTGVSTLTLTVTYTDPHWRQGLEFLNKLDSLYDGKYKAGY